MTSIFPGGELCQAIKALREVHAYSLLFNERESATPYSLYQSLAQIQWNSMTHRYQNQQYSYQCKHFYSGRTIWLRLNTPILVIFWSGSRASGPVVSGHRVT